MKRLEEMSSVFQSSGVERHPAEPKSQTGGKEDAKDKEEPWEMVMDKKHFKLWRRPITGTHLYQYRGGSGTGSGRAAFQLCSSTAPVHRAQCLLLL